MQISAYRVRLSRPASRTSEGFVHLFDLRAGIDELDKRIFARGIEVKRLVDYAVEVGDAIFGFDFEDFRKFETGFEELRDVGGFEIEELGALRVGERGFWSSVHAGIGVGKISPGIGCANGVREIAGSE